MTRESTTCVDRFPTSTAPFQIVTLVNLLSCVTYFYGKSSLRVRWGRIFCRKYLVKLRGTERLVREVVLGWSYAGDQEFQMTAPRVGSDRKRRRKDTSQRIHGQ